MRAIVFVALALVVVVALGDETYSADSMSKMSKSELISALTKTQKSQTTTHSELESARKQIRDLHAAMHSQTKAVHFSEKVREVREAAHKKAQKKKALAKKKAKLAKKEKLSDILMDHGAKFLAFKAAKEYKDEHSDKQKIKVLKAARKGGRAGAVCPIKKVARAAAVTAVKQTRLKMKKAGKHLGKHKLRKHCLEAAKKAVKTVLKEQDDLIEKAAQKWAKAAIKKYPPAIAVSEHPDKPNHFTAPPMIHLSLTGAPPPQKEVKKTLHQKKTVKKVAKKVVKKVAKAKKAVKKAAKKAVKKVAKVAKKVKTVAKKVAKKAKVAKVAKKVKKVTKQVAKAVAKAKAKAGKVVPEGKH